MSQKGFSLIELMVTLSVLAIILSLAVPGFNNFIQSVRAGSQGDSLTGALRLARSEAIKRGQNVGIAAADGITWHGGWNVWVDEDADRVLDSNETLIKTYPAFSGGNTVVATVTALGFDARGLQVGVTAGGSVSLQLRVGADYCSLERDITVNHLGRVVSLGRNCS